MRAGLDIYPENRYHALFGGLGVFCVIILSLSRPSVGNFLLPLTWLPIVSVFLWPRYAEPVLSLALIFCLGILHDGFAGYPLGLSSGLYVFVYHLSRTRFDFAVITFSQALIKFISLISLVSVTMLLFIFVAQNRFPVQDIVLETFGAIVFFPIFYIIRFMIRHMMISIVNE